MIENEGQLLLVNKPHQWTSFDVVNKIRYALKIKKVGHAGTLDPLATGLLLVCTGRMTKKISTFQDMEKEYTGTLVLGKSTPSLDLETTITDSGDTSSITEKDIHQAAQGLTGALMQTPPAYSAIKIKGQRSYQLSRKGKSVNLDPRPVYVSDFQITDIRLPEVDFKVTCSKGTYIRSLARDLGAALHVGAYLSALCRTRIGQYRLEDAVTIQDISSADAST